MPYPLHIHDVDLPDQPALVALIGREMRRPDRITLPEPAPAWVRTLIASGELERYELLGLIAALLREPKAGPLCLAASEARIIADPELGGPLLEALQVHDLGVLLRSDPVSGVGSVEDALLGAAAQLCDTSDPALRDALLERLRHTGLREAERRILCRDGNADEVQRWLPAVLSEFNSEVDLTDLRLALGRPEPIPQAIFAALVELPARTQRLLADQLRDAELPHRDAVLAVLGG